MKFNLSPSLGLFPAPTAVPKSCSVIEPAGPCGPLHHCLKDTEPWLLNPFSLVYHGYFHQVPATPSGVSKKQGTGSLMPVGPKDLFPLPGPRHLFLALRKYLPLALLPLGAHTRLFSSVGLVRLGKCEPGGSVSRPTLWSTSPAWPPLRLRTDPFRMGGGKAGNAGRKLLSFRTVIGPPIDGDGVVERIKGGTYTSQEL